MRILAVTPYYEPEGGGLERYAHAILTRLAAQGHEVHVVAFTRRGLPGLHQDGLHVERLAPRYTIGNTPIRPAFRNHVSDAIAVFRPDVVVAHTPVPFPAEMAYLAARRRGVPFVATYHAGRLRGSSPLLQSFAFADRWTFERRMLAGAARLIAVSPFVRDRALRRHRDRVRLVPPGVDPNRFSPNGGPAGPEVLFVGPLDSSYRWKGLDVLWDAFQQVHRQLPEATLHLVGDGDRFQEFAKKAHDAGPFVRLAGRLTDQELVKAYRKSAVVVLPSTTEAESFGMVLAEANACARPVVASRIGGIPDFVRDGENGLLAPPGDAADLARCLLQVLQDEEAALRMGERGRALVLAEHGWDGLTARTMDVLQEAVAG